MTRVPSSSTRTLWSFASLWITPWRRPGSDRPRAGRGGAASSRAGPPGADRPRRRRERRSPTGRVRPPTGTGDGRPDGRSRPAPAAVRPRTRPRSTRRAGERSAGGTVASGRPGSQVRSRTRSGGPAGSGRDGQQVAAVRRRDGELARDAGRGEPAPSRRAGARGRPDPRSRSRPSGRTGPRHPPRRPSCGRARSAGARRVPAIPQPSARIARGLVQIDGRARQHGPDELAHGRKPIGRDRGGHGGGTAQASRRSTRPSPTRRRTSASRSAS